VKPALTVTSDFTSQFNEAVKKFRNDDVLVGIPADATARKDDTAINNATILAINEFGSPANNIPARPVMAIGIRNAQKEIAEEFRKAAVGVLSKGISALDIYFNRAGIIASTSIKKAINDQEGISPPAPSTIAARKSKGFKGEKALLVTGQMRNAITYVIRGKS
jgi:hypothetical protein